MKYKLIETHQDQYPISLMCRVWRKQPFSAQKMANLLLLMHIRDIFTDSRNIYDSCRSKLSWPTKASLAVGSRWLG